MKVSSNSGVGRAASSGSAVGSRPTAGGFSPFTPTDGPADVAASGPAARVAGVMTLDALLALQGAEGPLERRRKAVRRGGQMLDALDALKLAVLDGGEVSKASLDRLMRLVGEQREALDNEPGLVDVLNQIETRAAVELAKHGS